MRLFLAWSGGRSHRLAELLRTWLETHYGPSHGVSAFVSSDIAKGAAWFGAIGNELSSADAGVVCLTPESLDSRWIAFESGALVASVRQRTGHERIFSYLLDVRPTTLSGPLASYQSSMATKADTYRFVTSLLALTNGPPTASERFEHEFEQAWVELERGIEALAAERVVDVVADFDELFDRKTFDEPITECMDQRWFDRYDAAVLTLARLRERRAIVATECGPFVADAYQQLIDEIDGYVMDLRALLFSPAEFPLLDNGRRDVPLGVETVLERRRKAIGDLVAVVTDPAQQAYVDDAFRFEHARSFAARKSLIHRLERSLAERPERFPTAAQLLDSDWTLDRVAAHLRAEAEPDEVGVALDECRRELERARAVEQPSLIALHYSLRSLLASLLAGLGGGGTLGLRADEVTTLLADIGRFVTDRHLDGGGQLRQLLARCERAAGADGP